MNTDNHRNDDDSQETNNPSARRPSIASITSDAVVNSPPHVATTTPDANGSDGLEVEDEEKQVKRRAIQAIMKDKRLDDRTRRQKIQALMDGSSSSSTPIGSLSSLPAASSSFSLQRSFSGALPSTNVNSAVATSPSINPRSVNERSSSMSFPIQQTGSGNGANSTTNQSSHSSLSMFRRSSFDATASDAKACRVVPGSSNNHQTQFSTVEVVKCIHYERNCNIISPCCQKVFGCRICHDEYQLAQCGNMDRFAIREVICKKCHTRQERSNKCINCDVTFGDYHCNICNLWMGLDKEPFHCEKCGICRVGGRDNFRHCDKCCMCISIQQDSHQCFKEKYKNECPICREDMHTSRSPPQDLPCGHVIHSHCFRRLASFDYRCPICKKTVIDQSVMLNAWNARARDIEAQPMPADLARIVTIMCNDCEEKTCNLPWHFLGVQCPKCKSFNTVVESLDADQSTSST